MEDHIINEVEFDFTPFFDLLDERDISQSSLIKRDIVSPAMLGRLRHNENITVATLGRLMNVLDVADSGKIVELSIHHRVW